jgi:TonB family protein
MKEDRLDRFIVVSIVLHGALFGVLVFSPGLFPMLGAAWGTPEGSANVGINAKIVGSISGVPLPTPPVVNETAPANDSPGLYKSEPAPPKEPDKTAEPIPDATAPVKTAPPKPKPVPPAPKQATPAPETPSNAVPYGEGGKPALAYGQFQTGAGEAGIGFGDAAFGDRYGTYVNTITRIISSNWLKSMVDSRVSRAPRVYLTFTIGRNGKISNVEVQQSSGIPTLDRSAQRAVLVSDPLPPLPSDYRGSDVNVRFYFEYSR